MKLIYSIIIIKEIKLYPVNEVTTVKSCNNLESLCATNQQTPKDKIRYNELFKSSNQELCFQGRLVYILKKYIALGL